MPNNPVIDLDKISHLSYDRRFAYEIIHEIREAKGTNAKIAVLEKAKTNQGFVNGLFLCYNPRISFYLKKIPDYEPAKVSAYHLEKVVDMLKSLYKREVTGNAAIQYLKNILETADPLDAKFVEQILRRDMQCGLSTTSINKVIPGLIPTYEVMLCESYSKQAVDDFAYPCFEQTKMDGARANLHYNRKTGQVELILRSGEVIEDVPPQFIDVVSTELATQPPFDRISFVLDGEILVIGPDGKYLPRKDGNGLVNALINGNCTPEEIASFRFVTWDFTEMEAFWSGSWKVPYKARFEALSLAVGAMTVKGIIRVNNTRVVHNSKEAHEAYREEIEAGEEGSCLKTFNGHWEAKRVSWQIKMKEVLEMDVIIVGVEEGKKGSKNEGKCGALLYESLDGDIAGDVGSGLSAAQRVEFWENPPIGRIANVEYNSITKSKNPDKKPSLYLAVFVELRVDVPSTGS